jgi:hypothetical protein
MLSGQDAGQGTNYINLAKSGMVLPNVPPEKTDRRTVRFCPLSLRDSETSPAGAYLYCAGEAETQRVKDYGTKR